MKTKMALWLFVLTIIATTSDAQDVFVNRVYQDASGSPVFNPILNPFGVQWSHSISNVNGDIITVGNTSIVGQGENIYLIKRNSLGNIVFQTNYNTAGTNNDYGINLYEASNGEIFVCGTTDNGGTTNYDCVILRYSAGGTLLNSTTYAGTSGKNDIATAIMVHPTTNNLILAVTNENTATGYDYMVLELNKTNLGYINRNTYDYNSLIEIALGIEVDSNTGEILIIGGSQSSISTSAYAIARFNGSTLGYVSDTRTDLLGSPNDQATAYKKDASNNIFITGKTWNGADFDLKTVKINGSNYTIAWTSTVDVNGLDDVASTIDLDPTNGNVIIGGFATRSGNLTDMISIRYNGSNGSTISTFNQTSENVSGSALIKKLCTSSTGNVYFVGGEKGSSGSKQVVVGKINPTATSGWQRKIVNGTDDILPSDIQVTGAVIAVISVLDSVIDSYLETGYEEFTLDTARTFIGGEPCWKKRELLVSFRPNAMNKNALDNLTGTRISEFGDLSDYLTSTAYNAISNAFEGICRDCDIKAVKVYDFIKTTDSSTVTRLGQNVPIPSFWTTLLLQFPNSITIQQAQAVLQGQQTYVTCSQPNNFMTPLAPNDSLWNLQRGLHPVTGYLNSHINVEDAWNVVTGCGASHIRAGIFDTGVMWKHKDFGYTGSLSSAAGKIEGWMFGVALSGGVNIRQGGFSFSMHTYDWLDHGTCVAGIIGGLRNNTSGIAGIAGGDVSNGNKGVSLRSLNTQGTNMFWTLKAMAASAIDDGATPFSYGVDLTNHSYKMQPGWYPVDSFPLYRDQVHFHNRMQIPFIASRGNYNANDVVVPAVYDSSWVISVGANDSTGNRWSGSSYGSGMDIIAPGVFSIIHATSRTGGYVPFAGTSGAAPHAAGVVALMQSYMNDSVSRYMNLAPEDCDFVLQRSATDLLTPGLDSLTGYGRLNAGNALRMIEKPLRILYHFGTNTITPHTISKSVYANYDTVKLTERYETPDHIVYNPGKYWIKTFQIDATVSHPGLYPTDSVMYHWPRPSSSFVYDLPNAQKRMDMHERVKFTSFSPSSASLRGYIYQVKDSTNTNVLGWWPCDTTFAVLFTGNKAPKTLMEYSVLSKNKAVGVDEYTREQRQVKVFPNPASHGQVIEIKSVKETNCEIELYDIMGRQVRTVYRGKVTPGKNYIEHNLDGLANSMYIYVIRVDGKTLNEKFIKE